VFVQCTVEQFACGDVGLFILNWGMLKTENYHTAGSSGNNIPVIVTNYYFK